jgi:hypothetical protein
MHINLQQAKIYWSKNNPRDSKRLETQKSTHFAQEQTRANPKHTTKELKQQAKDIQSDIQSIIKEKIKEEDKVKKCFALINEKVLDRFGQVFNSHYFIGKTIEFFRDIDDKQIFMFLIDNLRAYQRKQGFGLHQACEREPPYQQVLRQLFESSCKKQVTINGRVINLSPRQAKIILYNLPQWIKEFEGFKGYQKAGKELGLGPINTYKNISAIMKAVGQEGGLEKLLQWNQINSSDWTSINKLFNILNSEKERKEWLNNHKGFNGYQKAGKELDLGPNQTYGVISAIMKAVGQQDGLEKLLQWNQINSSDWAQINKLFNTLNTEKKRNNWLQEHQGFTGYLKAGKELDLGPDSTYRVISAIMKAVGQQDGLEVILKWNQINSSDWNQVNELYNALNSENQRKKWLQQHQGFTGYQKAGTALKLNPLDTYQTISAIMKAVGEKRGLEEILKWNKIKSNDLTTVIMIHKTLSKTALDDDLKQSLLLLFSKSKDSPNKIIRFIRQYTEKLDELKGLIEEEGKTPDYNTVFKELNISPDMLRALFLSYRSYKLKSFAYKVLGAVYLVRPTKDSEEKPGLGSSIEAQTDNSNLQRAGELLSFLLSHKDLDPGIKNLINQYLFEQDENLIVEITTKIPEEILQEFLYMNND